MKKKKNARHSSHGRKVEKIERVSRTYYNFSMKRLPTLFSRPKNSDTCQKLIGKWFSETRVRVEKHSKLSDI